MQYFVKDVTTANYVLYFEILHAYLTFESLIFIKCFVYALHFFKYIKIIYNKNNFYISYFIDSEFLYISISKNLFKFILNISKSTLKILYKDLTLVNI